LIISLDLMKNDNLCFSFGKEITVLILKHFMFAKKLSKLKIECECELQPVVEIVDFRKIVNVFI